MLKVGINGFGRIGRAIVRINKERPTFDIVAINDIDPNLENLAYLLKYDSTYGRFDGNVSTHQDGILIDNELINFYHHRSLLDVPWKIQGIDVLVDATGVTQNVLDSRTLIEQNVIKKAIITHSPNQGIDHTVIFGLTDHEYTPSKHNVVSTSICDANAVGPVLHLLDEKFGIEQGYITTLHPWLSYQNVLDGPVGSVSNPSHFWQEFSLGRSSPVNLIPKNTTLQNALCMADPKLGQCIDAISFRVPTTIVAAADITLVLSSSTTLEDVNEMLEEKAKESAGLLSFTYEPITSIDLLRTSQSATIDGRWTRLKNTRYLKLVLWYDNEWGYSNRVIDMINLISRSNHNSG